MFSEDTELGGVFRVTGLLAEFGKEWTIPRLQESAIVGTAIGLAMRGYGPVVEMQFDGFVFPAFEPDHHAACEADLPLPRAFWKCRLSFAFPTVAASRCG